MEMNYKFDIEWTNNLPTNKYYINIKADSRDEAEHLLSESLVAQRQEHCYYHILSTEITPIQGETINENQ